MQLSSLVINICNERKGEICQVFWKCSGSLPKTPAKYHVLQALLLVVHDWLTARWGFIV